MHAQLNGSILVLKHIWKYMRQALQFMTIRLLLHHMAAIHKQASNIALVLPLLGSGMLSMKLLRLLNLLCQANIRFNTSLIAIPLVALSAILLIMQPRLTLLTPPCAFVIVALCITRLTALVMLSQNKG